MMTTGRKRGFIFTVLGALVCVACFFAFYSLARNTDNETQYIETLQLEMQVGENYDLGPYLSETKGEVQLSPVFASDYKTKECVSLDAQGRLHAMRAGLYDLTLRITTESAFTSRVVKDVLKINLIVHDYEFEDYKPVYSYFDLQGSPNGKYVLARNMIFSDRTKSEIMDFSGILANPNGYTITVSDNLPLFESVNNNSVIRGLKVKTGMNGFTWNSDKTEDMMWLEPCGLIAIRLSSSVICDSSVEADIYGDPYFHGYVGANDGAILRCEFRGTRFDLAYGVNLDRAFAFSEGGEIRDCTVYADGYREDERIAGDRVSFFHTLPPKEEDFYRNEAEEVLKGNRVFDLSGKHEIDFTKPVVYEAKYLNDVDSSQIFFTLFVGCVAEFPYDMNEFFEQEQAELASYTDDLGNVYDADETWFLPDRVEAKITIKGKYTHTYFSGIEDSRTLNIYAAEEVVELPQGITLNGSVRFGEFSPSKVTLKFNTDTQVEDDLLFLHGEREGSFDSIQVEADLGASMVYEQREDGVYRADNGTLCRYDGAITDGKVTIPDGVTNMTADVFGDREFDCLDTNDLESLSVDSNASWQNNVTTLRLGAAMQISKLYIPDTIGRFSALKTIETEERTDGYYAEDGILYQDDAYEFVPCAYAAGGTLVLQDRVVSSFALTRNLAQTIVFDNVGELKSNAAYVAEFSEVIVMGGDAELTSVVLPDTVESIGRYAFYSATITERIKLPAGLKEIGAHAFRFCYIDEIEIPEGVTSIGEYAFYHSSLKKVIFPESLIKIGQYAFASTQLEEVTLPQNLESVDDFAFDHCSALQTVTTESADVAYGQNCFFETPFLSDGKTAEDGAIYLGNTIFALFDEGESLEVRYGTKEIKSLESLKIKSLKLPATLSYIPSIDDLPYLEQLWLGLAPQDAEETTYDVGSMKFKAKSDHLYIFLPKKVTFSGTISDDVYLCYNGTPDEFAVYARLDNFVDFYEYVYYYSQDGDAYNTWYYDENGNMVLRSAASSDKFTYVYSYDSKNVLQCSIIDCDMAYGSNIEIPSRSPFGIPVTILEGLGDTLFEEVRVSGMKVYFSGENNFNVKRMYIGEGCEVEHGLGRFVLNIDYLFIDIPELYFYNDEIQYVVVSQNTYRVDVTSKMNVYYEGTKDEWLENVISWTTPYAYYDEDGVFPDDGNLYWHYDESGLPVLWEQV